MVCELRGELKESLRCQYAHLSVLAAASGSDSQLDAVMARAIALCDAYAKRCGSEQQQAAVIAQLMAFWALQRASVEPLAKFLLEGMSDYGVAIAEVLFGAPAVPDTAATGPATNRALAHLATQTTTLTKALRLPPQLLLEAALTRITHQKAAQVCSVCVDGAVGGCSLTVAFGALVVVALQRAHKSSDARLWTDIKRNIRSSFLRQR